MKQLILFILFFACIKIYAQNMYLEPQERFVDSVVLNKINQYRTENNLSKIKFNKIANNLSESHVKYMVSKQEITHVEIIGKDTVLPNQRMGFDLYSVENVGGGTLCDKMVIHGVFYSTFNQINSFDKNFLLYVSDLIFKKWKNSIFHNKNMLDNKINNGAVSVKFDQTKSLFVFDFIAFE